MKQMLFLLSFTFVFIVLEPEIVSATEDIEEKVLNLQKSVKELWSYVQNLKVAVTEDIYKLQQDRHSSEHSSGHEDSHGHSEVHRTEHSHSHHPEEHSSHGVDHGGYYEQGSIDHNHHGDNHHHHSGHEDSHTDHHNSGQEDSPTDHHHSGHEDSHTDHHNLGHEDSHTDHHNSGHEDNHADHHHSGHGDSHADHHHSGHGDSHAADDHHHSGHGDSHAADDHHHSGHGDSHAADDHHHSGQGDSNDQHNHSNEGSGGNNHHHSGDESSHNHSGHEDHHDHYSRHEGSHNHSGHEDDHSHHHSDDHHQRLHDHSGQEDQSHHNSGDNGSHNHSEHGGHFLYLSGNKNSHNHNALDEHHHHEDKSQNKNEPNVNSNELPRGSGNHQYVMAICEMQPNEALSPIQRQSVKGTVFLWQSKFGGSLNVYVRLNGLKEDHTADHLEHHEKHLHGFHVHSYANLSQSCQSTGPHFNPENVTHGGPDTDVSHVGDLGNIECDDQGFTDIAFTAKKASLTGPDSIVGKSLAIHAGKDDYGQGDTEESKKTGNSGPRVACCVIHQTYHVPNRVQLFYRYSKRRPF